MPVLLNESRTQNVERVIGAGPLSKYIYRDSALKWREPEIVGNLPDYVHMTVPGHPLLFRDAEESSNRVKETMRCAIARLIPQDLERWMQQLVNNPVDGSLHLLTVVVAQVRGFAKELIKLCATDLLPVLPQLLDDRAG